MGSLAHIFRHKVVRLRELITFIMGWFLTTGRVAGILCTWCLNVQF